MTSDESARRIYVSKHVSTHTLCSMLPTAGGGVTARPSHTLRLAINLTH